MDKANAWITSTFEYRVRQLVPAMLLIYPSLWHHNEKKVAITGIESDWLILSIFLFIAIAGSFITETIAEHIEHKFHWRYWKSHPQFIRPTTTGRNIDISSEWFEYLKRSVDQQLIADKYLGALVDRMRLRCALIIPFAWNTFYFGYTALCSDKITKIDLVTSLLSAILTYIFFTASRSDVRELINLRKCTINLDD